MAITAKQALLKSIQKGQGREIALPTNYTRLVSYFQKGRGTGTTKHAHLTSQLLPHRLSEIQAQGATCPDGNPN